MPAPIGPAFFSTRKSSGVDIEIGRIDAGGEILQVLEHDGAALALEQGWVGGRPLQDGAVRRQAPEQGDKTAIARDRIVLRTHDAAIDVVRVAGEALAQGLARDGEAIEMQRVP